MSALGRSRFATPPVKTHVPVRPRTTIKKEITMGRKYIDCREFPGDIKCSIAISADSEKELLEAAVQHAVAVHGYKNTAGLRREIKSCFKSGTPPVAAPKRAKG
jgi:predicted small metal-binding protein